MRKKIGNYIFKNYQDLLNCKDVDIVYIALPNNLHYEWVDKCIEKNKKAQEVRLVEKNYVRSLRNSNFSSS